MPCDKPIRWNLRIGNGSPFNSFNMNPQGPEFAKCPLDWIEALDLEQLSFDKATWVPLVVSNTDLAHGEPGKVGYRRQNRNIDSIIVPLDQKKELLDLDWQSISRQMSDHAWADETGFCPPGCYRGDSRVLYPVIERSFETGEPTQWDLLQELEVGLQLFRKGDTWIRPDENDVEVAKLERNRRGEPSVLMFRSEHLRDYLCAKKAALLLTGFWAREAVEEVFSGICWENDESERVFAHGRWNGTCHPIHEGGAPFGSETAVVHIWRESVNPTEDMPQMPRPAADPGMKSRSSTWLHTGRKLHRLYGLIWVRHWIGPAIQSPRIRGDEVEARVHFQVENQENKTLNGKALEEYRGWLWFRPTVMRFLSSQPKGVIKWYTSETGEVGPVGNRTLHFGINKIGLVNVLGYKMAQMPEWVQKLWVAYNVPPEGGLSLELHQSQNLADPAESMSPEMCLWHNLVILNQRTSELFQKPILKILPKESELMKVVHRFYCESFEDVCQLCKELHRVVIESLDVGLINSAIDPGNAAEANSRRLGSIKRIALWLNSLGLDGAQITSPLAAIYDLRIADAHVGGEGARRSLELLGFSADSKEYQRICSTAISMAADCVATLVDAIEAKAGSETAK